MGADLLEVGRLRAALKRRPALRERLFTPSEISYSERKSDPASSLAVRFAAKEAVGKLLETGVLSWQEIEVWTADENRQEGVSGGAPRVRLSGRTEAVAAGLGVGEIALTLTHTEATAAAVAAAGSGGKHRCFRRRGMGESEEWPQRRGGRTVNGHRVAGPGVLRGLEEGASGFTAGQMREMDRTAIEDLGIPGAVLMERAALGVVEAVLELYAGSHTLILCGRGNNGGDGLAAARLLHLAGHPVVCAVAADDPSTLSPDAAANLRSAEKMGVNLRMGRPPGYLWEETELVVDCLLGTGATGEIREPLDEWARLVNAAGERGVPILAADVPSGVDATTGSVAHDAVAADHTVTFHSCKSGLLCPPGSEAAGEVLVWDIGIPRMLEPEPDMRVVTAGEVRIPGRRVDDHKYRAGMVAVLGGSVSYPGAAYLTARAAARAGAGYVRVVTSEETAGFLRGKLSQEVVATAGPGDFLGDLQAVRNALRDDRVDALVVGPGLGREEATAEVVRGVLSGEGAGAEASGSIPPTVLDADGLLAFAGRAEMLRNHPGLVLTPHIGELARLLEVEADELERSHRAAVRRAAEVTGQVVVLKGSHTLIAGPRGMLKTVTQGPPQLAVAGTGDVLSGYIATLLSRGIPPEEAACYAVWIHAEAGLHLVSGRRQGIMPEDLIDITPQIMSDCVTITKRRPGWRT